MLYSMQSPVIPGSGLNKFIKLRNFTINPKNIPRVMSPFVNLNRHQGITIKFSIK